MINFFLLMTAIILMIASLLYSIIIAITGNKKKSKISLRIISQIVTIISVIIPTYSSMDFSEMVTFDFNKNVYINTIISANAESPFTIKYTLDGTHPAKKGQIYNGEGITVKEEYTEDNTFTIYYQIGIKNLFYFSKVYTKEYNVNPAIELHPERIYNPRQQELPDIDSRLIFDKLTIDDKNGSFDDVIDGDISTKHDFKRSINNHHTIIFSESNKKDFSKIYLYQDSISRIDMTIDNKKFYCCKFDYSGYKKTYGLFEIDFVDSIPVNSSIKFDIYSDKDNYSVSDIWFDYYITP